MTVDVTYRIFRFPSSFFLSGTVLRYFQHMICCNDHQQTSVYSEKTLLTFSWNTWVLIEMPHVLPAPKTKISRLVLFSSGLPTGNRGTGIRATDQTTWFIAQTTSCIAFVGAEVGHIFFMNSKQHIRRICEIESESGTYELLLSPMPTCLQYQACSRPKEAFVEAGYPIQDFWQNNFLLGAHVTWCHIIHPDLYTHKPKTIFLCCCRPRNRKPTVQSTIDILWCLW